MSTLFSINASPKINKCQNLNMLMYIVKRLIIGEYLFGEIGELKKFTKWTIYWEVENIPFLPILSPNLTTNLFTKLWYLQNRQI